MSVCGGCYHVAMDTLKINVPTNRPILEYNTQNDSLKIFHNITELKSDNKFMKYGILTDDLTDLPFDIYCKKSVNWITEKDTENVNIYCDIWLMWKEDGKIVNIRDYGKLKNIRENTQFNELMKLNKDKQFILMNESINLLHKLLYDRKNITRPWFDSVQELNAYAHSAMFYHEMKCELIMTDEFKDYYKNTQKELLSKININLLD